MSAKGIESWANSGEAVYVPKGHYWALVMRNEKEQKAEMSLL